MPEYRFAATAYIIHRDRVLLIRHPKLGAWLPVGGKVEPGEHPDDAVRREVREETGLAVEIIESSQHPKKVTSYRYLQLEEVGDRFHLDFIYYARASSDRLELEAGLSARWFTFRDFLAVRSELWEDVRDELDLIFARWCQFSPYDLIDPGLISAAAALKPVVAVVNHSDEKTVALVERLRQVSSDVLYVEKGYSGTPAARRQLGKLVHGGGPMAAAAAVAKIKRSTRPALVMDMSGWLAQRLNAYPRVPCVVVEDTANGLYWIRHQRLRRPIISVAYSSVKRYAENGAVAQGLFSSLLAYAASEKQSLYYAPVLLAGYGSIGSIAAHLLAGITPNLAVYDSDYRKLLLARSAGFQTVENLNTIGRFSYLVGTTGDPASFPASALAAARDGVCLVNGSTGQWEFEASFFAGGTATQQGDTEVAVVHGKAYRRLNRGYPLNFWRGNGTEPLAIGTTFACMLEAGLRMLTKPQRLASRVHEVDEIYPSIADPYLRYYYQRFGW